MVCSADENGFLYLMVFQPVGHLLGDALDAALLKGDFQPGSLQQLGVAGRTGAAIFTLVSGFSRFSFVRKRLDKERH